MFGVDKVSREVLLVSLINYTRVEVLLDCRTRHSFALGKYVYETKKEVQRKSSLAKAATLSLEEPVNMVMQSPCLGKIRKNDLLCSEG